MSIGPIYAMNLHGEMYQLMETNKETGEQRPVNWEEV